MDPPMTHLRFQQRPLGSTVCDSRSGIDRARCCLLHFQGARGAVTIHVRDHPPQTAIPGAPLIRRQGSTIRVTMAPATE